MELAIITGVSSGLGKAAWEQAQRHGMAVLGIARRAGIVTHGGAQSLAIDLTSAKPWEQELDRLLDVSPQTWTSVYIILAAGQLGPVCSIEQLSWQDLEALYRLNVIAPLRLCTWALKRFGNTAQNLRIAPISSGAASKVYQGWGAYCGTKAALRMSTQVAAAEAEASGRKISYVSYSPGVMDSPMQDQVRASDVKAFPSLPRFLALHEKGQLVAANDAAEILWKLLKVQDLPAYLEYRYGDPWPL